MTDAPQTARVPDFDEARSLVEDGLRRDAIVTLFGRCTVEYDGRAASTLGPGDRLIVLKPDGTALVHSEEGQQPVNWQPPGCAHAVSIDDDHLVLRSERDTPAELLVVTFDRIDHVALFDATDPNDLSLTGTEADLKQRILADPALVEDGFEPRATERQTPAGAVDIYGEDDDGNAVVVELKRRRVGPDAVGQLARYVDALERDLHAGATVRGILVAPSVTDRARRLLGERGLEFVPLSPTTESGDPARE